MNKEEFIDKLRVCNLNGFKPYITVLQTFDLSPEAIRNLSVTDDRVSFKYTLDGEVLKVILTYNEIEQLFAAEKPINNS